MAMSKRAMQGTAMTIFIAIIASMAIVLPIVVGILASEIYADELVAQELSFQLGIMSIALIVLIVVNVYTLKQSAGFRGK